MGSLVIFPAARSRAARLTKKQLAGHLGYSRRWIELQMRDGGLPFYREPNGEARFLLSEVTAWMETRRSANAG